MHTFEGNYNYLSILSSPVCLGCLDQSVCITEHKIQALFIAKCPTVLGGGYAKKVADMPQVQMIIPGKDTNPITKQHIKMHFEP